MAIFDVFTGKPAKEAAQQTRAFLDRTGRENTRILEEGRNLSLENLGQGYGQARTALTGGTDAARSAVMGGYDDAQDFLTSGAGAARGLYDESRGYLDRAGGAYDPLAAIGTKYGTGTSLYLDSLGVNGPEGIARASASFVPSMAYDFNLTQGLDAINRARNARGMANSGNTDRDAQEFGAGLASKEITGWQDRLAGLINPELTATSGAAAGRSGALTNLANLGVTEAGMESTLGRDQSALASGRASMLADLERTLGRDIAGTYTGEGTGSAAINTGAAQGKVGNITALATPYANTYGQEAKAAMEGSGNLWNVGLNLAKLGVGAAGGLPGLSGFGGNPSSAAFGSNPFTPSGNINPTYLV